MPVAKVSYHTTTSPVRTVFNIIKFMTKDIIGDGSYIYFAMDENFRGRPTKNWKTIRKILKSGKYTYMTFNGYNLPWCGKTSRNLQWIATITVDIDEKCPVDELLDAVAATGLEAPTLIVETSRGYHLSWKLDTPLRAYPANQIFVQAVTATIIEELRKQGITADPAYRTPERYTRIPYCVAWFRPTAYPLQFFLDWIEINGLKLKKGWYRRFGRVAIAGDIINDPAVQRLLEGVRVSIRNESAYALALCYKAEGYPKDEVVRVLLAWNMRNEEPLPVKELLDTINSAFRYDRLPSPETIGWLAGIRPRFRIVRAAPRGSTVGEKIVAVIAGNGGELATTFDGLAGLCGVSRRTLSRHVQKLKKEGKITARTLRCGRRGSITVFSLTTKYNTTEGKSKASNKKFSRDCSKIPGGHGTLCRFSYQQQGKIPNLNCDTLYIRYTGVGGRGSARATVRETGRTVGGNKGSRPVSGHTPCSGVSAVLLADTGRTRGSPVLFRHADQRNRRGCVAVQKFYILDRDFWLEHGIDLSVFEKEPVVYMPAELSPGFDLVTIVGETRKAINALKKARGKRIPKDEQERLETLGLPELLRELEQVAVERYDGHYTLLRFTANWRCCLGTVQEITVPVTGVMGEGKTLEEAIRETLTYRIDDRFVEEASKAAWTIYNLSFQLGAEFLDNLTGGLLNKNRHNSPADSQKGRG